LGRDPAEDHRVASPLELFFDLSAVVAIALCAEGLHHGLVDGHPAEALLAFAMVFFSVWWAWMNFTWFGSAYDNDDWGYRAAVFVQMTGALVLAAGVPRVFAGDGFDVVTIGYLIMRLGLISQWLRVAKAGGQARRSARRYAGGLVLLQAAWVSLLAMPRLDTTLLGFAVLVGMELSLPFWAESGHPVRWHPRHVAERYGLFTIIVLGESVLSSVIGVQTALEAGEEVADLATVVVGGLLVVFALWWLYFDQPSADVALRAQDPELHQTLTAAIWGYGHFLIFAAAAAVGSGLLVAVDHVSGHSELDQFSAGLTITVPVALYVLFVWGLHASGRPRGMREAGPFVVAALVVASSWTPEPVLLTGLVLTGALVARGLTSPREELSEVLDHPPTTSHRCCGARDGRPSIAP
jgi:low temperature requirement protein LtrA